MYRREIDGLRALAVLPVMLFHAGFEVFKGGYIGVDIFFVISGYLITTLIVNDLNNNSFSIKDFYERRARRLLPALFLVVLACIPIAWFWMLPSDLKYFGQSLVSVSSFSSNIFFWLKTGYFDAAAELNPLLHTWSLAVEEQYYIVFPLVLITAWKTKGSFRIILIVSLLVMSLMYANWTSGIYPNFAFYMLPTRAWELLTGALLALWLIDRNKSFELKIINQSLSLLGIGLIIFSLLIFDSNTPFPSLITLVPVIGAALVILTATEGTIMHKLLSFKPLAGLGLISYSAYLWHQPILAFARYRFIEDLTVLMLLLLCAMSIVIAYISWRWVETPFRNPEIISSKLLIKLAAFFILIISSFGLYLHSTNGALNRIPPKHLESSFYKDLNVAPHQVGINKKNCVADTAELCELSPVKKEITLLIGDSHSGDFLNTFNKYVSKKEIGAFQLSMGGCTFMPMTFLKEPECKKATLLLKENIDLKLVNRIILITNQYKHLSFLSEKEANLNIDYFLAIISSAINNNIEVIYFTPRPSFKFSVPRNALQENRSNPITLDEKYKDLLDSRIDTLTKDGLKIFDQREIIISKLCDQFYLCNDGLDGGRPFYRDSNHLSKHGAAYVFAEFEKIL